MNKCGACGGRLVGVTLETYQCDDQIRFFNVFIMNTAVQYKCGECGESLGTQIPDIAGLEAAVAVARIGRPEALKGRELKFLRRACGLLGKDLAEYLEVTPSTLSHWENERDPIGAQSDKLVRLVVGYVLSDRAPGVPFDKRAIATMRIAHLAAVDDPSREVPFVFERVPVLVDHKQLKREWIQEAA